MRAISVWLGLWCLIPLSTDWCGNSYTKKKNTQYFRK